MAIEFAEHARRLQRVTNHTADGISDLLSTLCPKDAVPGVNGACPVCGRAVVVPDASATPTPEQAFWARLDRQRVERGQPARQPHAAVVETTSRAQTIREKYMTNGRLLEGAGPSGPREQAPAPGTRRDND